MAPFFHKHVRLPGRDYTQGTYFVTLCTQARAQVFGRIIGVNTDAYIELTDIGRIVDECWHAIPDHFPHARPDVTQMMPDHLHGIIVMRRTATIHGQSTQWVDPTAARTTPNGPRRGSLGAIIGAFKSETTKRVNRLNSTMGQRLWQFGYYERVIREQGGEYGRIEQYIAENPANWR